jgi:phospholipase C
MPMQPRLSYRYALNAATAALFLSGCGGAGAPPTGLAAPTQQSAVHRNTKQAIQNVIVVIQETRSFDNLFAGYPGADAPTKGLTSAGKYVRLRPIRLEDNKICTSGNGDTFEKIYDSGKMDGWNLINRKHPLCPYTRVERSETRPYWDLTKHFVLADKMFSSTHFGRFVNSLYLVTGTTKIARDTYIVGIPTSPSRWGCDAPPGTETSLLKDGQLELNRGPFPCFDQFPSLANLLDKANVAWRFYYGGKPQDNFPFNPYSAMKYVFDGPDWKNDMSVPATNVLNDIAQGNLPPVSWVLSAEPNSDFPGNGGGPTWVKTIVQAAQTSSYWKHIAIVVIWNDSGEGNFYDNVAPPQLDPMGLGFRVPMLVVSPYAKHGYVSHTQYEFGSILKFIEENWNLGSLGSTDQRANSIGDVFDQ